MRGKRCGVELRAQDVADGVALEGAADPAAIPMHVLQAAVAIVGRGEAEVRLEARAPGLGQVLDREPAFQHGQLQVEPHHDVQIVGHLVGVGADQRPLDLVDGAVEGLQRHALELAGEGIAQLRIEMLPEAAAAADHVLPKPRLALVHAGGGARAQRRAIQIGADALLVERMARLVQGREQRLADVVVAARAW